MSIDVRNATGTIVTIDTIDDLIALLPIAPAEDRVALTKVEVTMTGASGSALGADATRKIVIISNAAANSPAAIDPTGGTCALDAGIAILPGLAVQFTGVAAQSAMTHFGTNAQKLTIYTG